MAKAKLATPFKRPENGQFRPGVRGIEFFFDETGDTNALTEAGSSFGGFGGVFKLSQKNARTDEGELSLFYRGDKEHTGLDNCAFWTKDAIVFVEDAGDTLHTQRNAFDSGFLFDVDANYAHPQQVPVRSLPKGETFGHARLGARRHPRVQQRR